MAARPTKTSSSSRVRCVRVPSFFFVSTCPSRNGGGVGDGDGGGGGGEAGVVRAVVRISRLEAAATVELEIGGLRWGRGGFCHQQLRGGVGWGIASPVASNEVMRALPRPWTVGNTRGGEAVKGVTRA
jgi:hypothetical protein